MNIISFCIQVLPFFSFFTRVGAKTLTMFIERLNSASIFPRADSRTSHAKFEEDVATTRPPSEIFKALMPQATVSVFPHPKQTIFLYYIFDNFSSKHYDNVDLPGGPCIIETGLERNIFAEYCCDEFNFPMMLSSCGVITM